MKPRLLFVTDVAPLPLDRGQRVRVSSLLAACARVFRVTFLGPPPQSAELRGRVEAACDQVVWLNGSPHRAGGGFRSFLSAARAAPGLLRPASLRLYLPYARALAGVDLGAFDIFWAERPHIARLLDRVRARTILDLDDVEHVRIRRGLAFLPRSSLLSRAQLGFRYHLYRRMELVWSRGFLATVVCSEEDRRYLESEGCTNVVVVPNPAPQDPETKTPRTKSDGLRIAFLGNLLHPPNVDSLLYLTREILPLVRQREPGATLEVFGPHASPKLIARCGPGVIFHGFVEDLGCAMARCDVFAAPIRFGSGTRVKLLDAMAHGIPIVTTLLGVEGLSMVDGEHALIADSPETFADRLLTLYKDPVLAEGLAANARLLLDRRFRSEVVQEEMARWLSRLVPMRGASD